MKWNFTASNTTLWQNSLKVLSELLTKIQKLGGCLICQQECQGHPLICQDCQTNLPYYHLDELGYDLLNWPAVNKLFVKRKFDRLIACSPYLPPLSNLLTQLKYQHKTEYSQLLAFLFSQQCPKGVLEDIDMLIPVPLHHSKWQTRGFNQALLIAKPLAKLYQLPLSTELVIREKKTEAQVGKTGVQRRQNLRQAFSLSKHLPIKGLLKGKHVLLVDDVITTGTTVNEISRLLKSAGVDKVTVATICLSD